MTDAPIAERMARAVKAAHLLLVWTHQYATNVDQMSPRGWWHVKDLHPSCRDNMNSAEQELYDALQETPD